MEDAHFALGALTSAGCPSAGWDHAALFGVLDGHGGHQVSRFCQQRLPIEIARKPASDIAAALTDSFHLMDDLLRQPDGQDEIRRLAAIGCSVAKGGVSRPWMASPDWIGCTAVVCVVQPDALIVANAGDSRAVLCRGGQAVPLSEDHKPNVPTERERIRKAGGVVERSQVGIIVQHRVNGNLNLSRSIGDLEYKKGRGLGPHEQMISATPDVQIFPRESEDEFMILACDGIWDVLPNQDVVDFVRDRLPELKGKSRSPKDSKSEVKVSSRSLSGICEELMDHCLSPDLAQTGGLGGDNMTAMIVVFASSEAVPKCSARSTGRGGAAGAAGEGRGDAERVQSFDIDGSSISPSGFCGCANNLQTSTSVGVSQWRSL